MKQVTQNIPAVAARLPSVEYRVLVMDSAVYGLSMAISRSVILLTTPVLTRLLPPADYALLDTVVLTAAMLMPVISLGLESGLMRYWHEFEGEERHRFVSTTIYFVAAMALIISILGCLASRSMVMLLFHNETAIPYLRIAIVTAAAQQLGLMFLWLLRLSRRLKAFIVATTAFVIPTAILFVQLVISRGSVVDGYFNTILVGTVVQMIVLLFLCHRDLRLSFVPRLLRRALIFAVPLAPTVFLAAFVASLGRYLLIAYADLQQVAEFAVANRIASALTLVIAPFLMAWQPFAMSVIKRPDAGDVYARVTRVAVLWLALASVALIWLSPEAVLVVAGRSYRETAPIVGLVVIGTLIGQLIFFFHLPITIAEKSHLLLYAQIMSAVTYLVSGTVMTKTGGVTGTAASFCFSNAVLVASIYLFGRDGSAIRFPVVRIAAVVIGMLIVHWTINVTNLSVVVRCAGAALSACAVTAAMLLKREVIFVQSLNGSWRASR